MQADPGLESRKSTTTTRFFQTLIVKKRVKKDQHAAFQIEPPLVGGVVVYSLSFAAPTPYAADPEEADFFLVPVGGKARYRLTPSGHFTN